MKKILLLTVSLLLVIGIAVGLTGCDFGSKKSYSLDTSGFNSTAVFGEELSLAGLKLVADGIDFFKVGVKTKFQNGVSGKTLAMVGYIKTENLKEGAKVIVQFASDADFQNIKHTITYTSELPEWTKVHFESFG